MSTDAAERVPFAPPTALEPVRSTPSPEVATLTPAEAFGLAAGDTALVVVAHPGDETRSMGAALADLCTLGVQVVVLSLTVGDPAPDDLGPTLRGLPDRRRAETARAAAHLGASRPLVLDFPAGRLVEFERDVAHVLRAALALHAPALVLAPWREEPEADHRTTGRATVRVAAEAGVRCSEFAVTVPGCDPEVVPPGPDRLTRVGASAMGRAARTRALAEYTRGALPLDPGDEIVVRP